jgi:N,N'-diacetyllegionaminate synthase
VKTLIIAEAGVNHNADLNMALRLVDVAVQAGADVVKFQTAVPEEVVTKHAKMAQYQIKNNSLEESQLAMTKRIHLPMEDFIAIKAYCASKNILFATTAFGPQSLTFIQALNLPFYKIPSGEITNIPYLRTIGAFGKPIILSTGMANLGEIEAAIDELERVGMLRTDITVLHCTTEYPAPMKEVNLRAIRAIGAAFGTSVGYSDHTEGIEVAIAAVAMGATVIEKHFTLDRNLPGPDHKASLEPAELKAMVTAIRNLEIAMGDGIKRLTPSEARNKPVVRKSLVASQAIKAGEVFSAHNITTKRPGTGISPIIWDEIMGRTAPRDFVADELIEL